MVDTRTIAWNEKSGASCCMEREIIRFRGYRVASGSRIEKHEKRRRKPWGHGTIIVVSWNFEWRRVATVSEENCGACHTRLSRCHCVTRNESWVREPCGVRRVFPWSLSISHSGSCTSLFLFLSLPLLWRRYFFFRCFSSRVLPCCFRPVALKSVLNGLNSLVSRWFMTFDGFWAGNASITLPDGLSLFLEENVNKYF